MTSNKFRPRSPQQPGPTRNLRNMATLSSGAQRRNGAATDLSLTYARAFRDIDPIAQAQRLEPTNEHELARKFP